MLVNGREIVKKEINLLILMQHTQVKKIRLYLIALNSIKYVRSQILPLVSFVC